MALVAHNQNGEDIFASQVKDSNQEFKCRFCGNTLVFVDATLKVKHFRHKVESDCTDEPETEEHEYYKNLVVNNLKEIGIGQVYPEHPLGRCRADIYLQRDNKRDIVFEVQATNYSFSKYEAKINCYAYRKLMVVYLFIGDDFFNEVRKNIFSLKEIEKRIFHSKIYLDTILGAYLDGETITIPSLKQKIAKGYRGLCSDRFIIDYKKSRKMNLNSFLQEVHDYIIEQPYSPTCFHSEQIFIKSSGKIPRYKIVCADCAKFIKWLPNKEALSLGFTL